MLTGGLITVAITYINEYSIPGKLFSLIVVLVVSFLAGRVVSTTIERFDAENRKKLEEEEKAQREAEELALATDGNVEEKK